MVARPDQQLGVRPNRFPIEQGKHPSRSPAAAHSKDGAHLIITEHHVQVVSALLVRPREVAVAGRDIATNFGAQAHCGNRTLRRFDLRLIVTETSGLDQSDRVTRPKAWGSPCGPGVGGCQRERTDGAESSHASNQSASVEHTVFIAAVSSLASTLP